MQDITQQQIHISRNVRWISAWISVKCFRQCVPKKEDTKLMTVTLPILNRFKKKKFSLTTRRPYSKVVNKDSITPQM